jgi:hypothetical protein
LGEPGVCEPADSGDGCSELCLNEFCIGLVGDWDGDGICDDGPADFCIGGEVEGCKDNCRHAPNPFQEDSGAIGSDPPDGVGDACQCGDVTRDGRVNSADATMIIRKALGLSSPVFRAPCNCDVTGDGKCNSADAVMIIREYLDLYAPHFGYNCGNYTGACQCDQDGNCLR